MQGCAGFDMAAVPNPPCAGVLRWCVKVAASFGKEFRTHAWLCEAHRAAFGYRLGRYGGLRELPDEGAVEQSVLDEIEAEAAHLAEWAQPGQEPEA